MMLVENIPNKKASLIHVADSIIQHVHQIIYYSPTGPLILLHLISIYQIVGCETDPS